MNELEPILNQIQIDPTLLTLASGKPAPHSRKFADAESVSLPNNDRGDRYRGTYIFSIKDQVIGSGVCHSKKEAKRICKQLEKELKHKVTFKLKTEGAE